MLVINQCSKYYGKQVVLENVSIKFPDSGFFAVTGKSGIGKTTLLNLIGSYDKPDKGDIELNGKPLSGLSPKELEYLRKNDIGFIFQDFFLLDDLTIGDNIKTVNVISSEGTENDAGIREILKKLEIEEIKDKYPNEVSGGERQRAAIARALMKGCKIILADEPTGNLDENNSENIYRILKELSREYLVIMVTHDPLGASYADHIIDMREINNSCFDFTGEKEGEAKAAPNGIKPPKKEGKTVGSPKFFFGLRFLKKKKGMFIPSFVIFALLMLLNLIIMNLALINPHYAEYNTYSANGINSVSYTLWGTDDLLGDTFAYEKKYDGLDIKKYVSVNVNLAAFSDQWYIEAEPSYTNLLRYIVIDDSLADGKIAVSEYLVGCLVNFGVFEKPSDILGKACFKLLDEVFTVERIEASVLADEVSHQQDIRVNYIKMSAASFERFSDYKKYETEGRVDIFEAPSTKLIGRIFDDDILVKGRFPENNSETALSVSYAANFDSATLIGSSITLYDKTYEVVGVIQREERLPASLYFNVDEYEKLAADHTLTLERRGEKGISVSLSDKAQSVELFEDMYREGFFANSDIRNDLYGLVNDLYLIKSIVFYVALFVVLASIGFIYYIYCNSNKSFKKEIAVLISQGANKKDIWTLVNLPILLVFVSSFVPALTGYFIAVPLIGKLLAKTVAVNVSILQYRFSAILISFAVSAAAYILSAFFSVLKIKRASVIDMLYNRK